jgi:hypothetical protein
MLLAIGAVMHIDTGITGVVSYLYIPCDSFTDQSLTFQDTMRSARLLGMRKGKDLLEIEIGSVLLSPIVVRL